MGYTTQVLQFDREHHFCDDCPRDYADKATMETHVATVHAPEETTMRYGSYPTVPDPVITNDPETEEVREEIVKAIWSHVDEVADPVVEE